MVLCIITVEFLSTAKIYVKLSPIDEHTLSEIPVLISLYLSLRFTIKISRNQLQNKYNLETSPSVFLTLTTEAKINMKDR